MDERQEEITMQFIGEVIERAKDEGMDAILLVVKRSSGVATGGYISDGKDIKSFAEAIFLRTKIGGQMLEDLARRLMAISELGDD